MVLILDTRKLTKAIKAFEADNRILVMQAKFNTVEFANNGFTNNGYSSILDAPEDPLDKFFLTYVMNLCDIDLIFHLFFVIGQSMCCPQIIPLPLIS